MNIWFEPGHVAIVTGGSRGLGREVARQLLSHGVSTIIDGREAAVLAEARLDLLTALNGAETAGWPTTSLVAVAGDVADSDHAHALIDAAKSLGRLDLLVNNASTLGAVPLPRVDQLDPEVLRRLFDVNLFAPIHLVQHALRVMRESGQPATIVNITSDAGVEAYPTWAGYGSTKAALEHVSRVLAAELEGSNVRVLVADPGDMDTQMHRDAIPDADPTLLRDPAESARALLHAIARMRHAFERVRLTEVLSA
jgi:NAD(P)-dependent dehydrogenase (short-subunit alcohol dehydrogenase family)